MKKIFNIIYYIVISTCILFIVFQLYNLINYNDLLKEKNNAVKDIKDTIIEGENIEVKYNKTSNELKEIIGEKNYNEVIKSFQENKITYENDINDLTNDIKELNSQVSSLEMEYSVLKKQKEENEHTVLISNFPLLSQYPEYPTGCESVALYMLLKYYNIDVNMDELITNLKKGDLPYKENNILYGGNPYLEFVGNPKETSGYGTYNIAIKDLANKYKKNIIDETGLSFNKVLSIVSSGKPVLVWTSMNLTMPYISFTWIYKPTNEKISWIANEHAVVIVGFNDNNVIIADPLTGTLKKQNRTTFEARFNSYGKRVLHY